AEYHGDDQDRQQPEFLADAQESPAFNEERSNHGLELVLKRLRGRTRWRADNPIAFSCRLVSQPQRILPAQSHQKSDRHDAAIEQHHENDRADDAVKQKPELGQEAVEWREQAGNRKCQQKKYARQAEPDRPTRSSMPEA